MTLRVLVHGAENVVGSRLAAALADTGWAAVDEVATGDARSLERMLGASQAVAHCALGSAGDVERGASSLYGLLEGMNLRPHVVHLGSMTVYGSSEGLVDESSELLADRGAYSAAQLAAEGRARQVCDPLIFRVGVEYGPRCEAWSGRVARWLRAGRIGDLGVLGDGCCNLIYVDDLISILVSGLERRHCNHGVFNLANPHRLTWNDYFKAFGIALGAVPVKRIGLRRLRWESRIAAPLLKAAEVGARAFRLGNLGVPPPIPPSLLEVCRQDIRLSTRRLADTFHPRWTGLKQGLIETARHYR